MKLGETVEERRPHPQVRLPPVVGTTRLPRTRPVMRIAVGLRCQ